MHNNSFSDSANNLIIITGPTATGKTALAIKLARLLKTEILSADSRQFYKDLKIGTATPSDEELGLAKHHFIGFLNIDDYYNVYKYEKDVLTLLEKLFMKYEDVIMCGGSGMYIKTICEGIDNIPDPDMNIRETLNNTYAHEGIQPLLKQLKELDPCYYESVDLSNHKRIIRALEVCLTSGKPYSSFLKKNRISRPFKIIKIGLMLPREELNQRIDKRVDEMIDKGLLEEAKKFFPFRYLNSLNTVGYKELFDYLEGKITFEKAVEKIKTNTRRYAKKQMTWLRRDTQIKWFHPDDFNAIVDYIQQQKHK